jgi:hypothetical protein
MTWSWDQTRRTLARRAAALRGPEPVLPPSESNPDGRPTRPDRLSIWPADDERFGIDVLYLGEQGRRRAEMVVRQIVGAGHEATMRIEGDGGFTVRFGPVSREEMLTVLNGYVW